MIRTTDLTFRYSPDVRFTFPDITCKAADSLLITGASGTGKTTLLHLLGGLLRAHTGEISIDDTNIELLTEKRLDHFRGQHVGIVLQQAHFIASLSVLENVILASWLANRRKSVDKAKALLEQLDLGNQMYKFPSRLSMGQQQRVTIARALINEPKLLLADEPTSSLDDANADIVADLLSGLSQTSGAALVIVTHDQRLKDRFPNSVTL